MFGFYLYFWVTMLKQDLHIHTIFSSDDSAIVPQQTCKLISKVRHAKRTGISDHFESLASHFDRYEKEVRSFGFYLGVEVDGADYVREASQFPLDYYIYHCRDRKSEYKGAEKLLLAGKPVIIAHPQALDTKLKKVPDACLIEVNNRYVWRNNWRSYFTPFLKQFEFVIGSDAHQPNWLNQQIAQYVTKELGIKEKLIFDANDK